MKELAQKHILTFTILILTFLLLIPLLKFSTQPMGFGDSNRYYKVALNPFLFTEPPWGYRILVPHLASALPFGLRLNFMIISYLSFVMINLILFYWLRKEHLSVLKSFCCCLFYTFSYAGVYNIHNFVHVGFFEHLLLLLGFIAIYKNKFLPLFLVILIGSFAKETLILLIPLYLIVNFHKSEWQETSLKTLMLSLLYLCIFYLIRASNLLYINKVTLSSYVNFYSRQWLYDAYCSTPINTVKMLTSAFAVWIPLAILGFLFSDRRSRLLTLFIPFSAAMIIIGGDAERAVAISFPAFLLLMSNLFRICKDKEVIALLLINVLVFLAYNHLWLRARFYVPIIWLCTVIFYLYLKKRTRLDTDLFTVKV